MAPNDEPYEKMATYLVSRDCDGLISKRLITRGKFAFGRFINMIMILFKHRPGFVKICLIRYQVLYQRHSKRSFTNYALSVSGASFWRNAVQSFAKGEQVVFDTGQKGTTRKKLYALGMLFGYYHTVSGQKPFEVRYDKHRRMRCTELDIDHSKTYTMKEIKKLRMNLPDMWVPVGDGLYKPAAKGWYKRGIMVNGTGVIKFTKVVSLGNELDIAKLFKK